MRHNNTYDITFDSYKLLPTEVEDPVGNTDSADIDYRVLAPWKVTDENDNRSAVEYDGLGLVVATAVMGKDGAGEGDTLADPTTEVEYDLFEWKDTQKPVWVRTKAREQHGGTATWLESYSYSDGLGREISRKVEAEPGDAPYVDAQGQLQIEEDADPRWVGTGRTVFDNKGNPVKQYEPFFSTTHEFEDEDEFVKWGVTPVLTYDPLGRVIRTDFPDDTFSKVEFDPWKQVTWDQNDTVDQTTWYSTRMQLSSGDPDRWAAELADDHAGTPAETHLDTLGRPFLTREDKGSSSSHDWVDTRMELDIEGNTLVVKDALSRDALTTDYSVAGEPMHTDSIDAGEHWVLDDVAGEEIYTWDSRDYRVRTTYDSLRRPTGIWVQQGAGTEYQREKLEYGEGETDPKDDNLRGQLVRHYDGAGLAKNNEFDFKGNLLSATRQLTQAYSSQPDWSASPSLETETFTQTVTYDALNRPEQTTLPDATVLRATYNNAGLLETVDAKVRGAASWTDFVTGIDYNAKGQRLEISYENGVTTTYTYDSKTFRLATLQSVRSGDGKKLQDLSYYYDPVGNIAEVRDAAHRDVFFNNSQVSPHAKYEYDPLYRLTKAEGREHARSGQWQPDHSQYSAETSIPCNQVLRLFTENYSYDGVGNITQMQHVATNGNWTRGYTYASGTNRLASTTPSVSYAHDASGNMTALGAHVSSVDWDHDNQMVHVELTATNQDVYFAYDGGGQRVRKVHDINGTLKEHIYLGAFEVYRYRNGGLDTERQTFHIVDNERRVAMVETKTWLGGNELTTKTPKYRYQLENHLGTACVEVNDSAQVISYEEYHPYGTTAYRAQQSSVDVSARRYRYTGKERDEETGLYYHGARYYAPWLGRWTATDPAGMVDGVCLYQYCSSSPCCRVDPSGTDDEAGVIGRLKRATGWFVDFNKSLYQEAKRQIKQGAADSALKFFAPSMHTLKSLSRLPQTARDIDDLFVSKGTYEAAMRLNPAFHAEVSFGMMTEATSPELAGRHAFRGLKSSSDTAQLAGELVLARHIPNPVKIKLGSSKLASRLFRNTRIRGSGYIEPGIPLHLNKGGATRTLDEAIALAKRHGLDIPKDVSFSVSNRKWGSKVLAEYFYKDVRPDRYGRYPDLTWDDLLSGGKVGVRINPKILRSDEAILWTFKHELHEIGTLREMFKTRGKIPSTEIPEIRT